MTLVVLRGHRRWGPRAPAAPPDLDAAVRLAARALALLSVLALVPVLALTGDAPAPVRAGGALGLLWLGWWWSGIGRGHRLVPAGEALTVVALAAVALAVADVEVVLAVVYAGCCLTLLGCGRRAATLILLGFTAAYLAAAAIGHPPGRLELSPAAVTGLLPGLPLAAVLTQLVREALGRRQRALRLAAILDEAVVAIGAAAGAASVWRAAGRAASRLGRETVRGDQVFATGTAALATTLSGADALRVVVVPGTAPAPLRRRLRQGGRVPRGDPAQDQLVRALALTSAGPHLLLFPIPFPAGDWATVAVATARPLAAELAATWRCLAAAVSAELSRVTVVEAAIASEARFRAFVESASDLIVAIDEGGGLLYVSPSVESFLGRPLDLADPPEWQRLVHPDDLAALRASVGAAYGAPGPGLPVDCRLLARDGGWRSFDVVPTNLLADPDAGAMVVTLRDISDRVTLEDQLRHQALHDPLTGLANRALLRDRLEHALAARERGHRALVLLLLDLDHFKDINDSFGHEAGDQVLLEMTRRIRSCLRTSDTCARLGGDEFAILIEDAAAPDVGQALAGRILEALRRPIVVSDRVRVTTGASVGITIAAAGAVEAKTLLQECDLALYRAKAEGRGRFVVYEATLGDETGRPPAAPAAGARSSAPTPSA